MKKIEMIVLIALLLTGCTNIGVNNTSSLKEAIYSYKRLSEKAAYL